MIETSYFKDTRAHPEPFLDFLISLPINSDWLLKFVGSWISISSIGVVSHFPSFQMIFLSFLNPFWVYLVFYAKRESSLVCEHFLFSESVSWLPYNAGAVQTIAEHRASILVWKSGRTDEVHFHCLSFARLRRNLDCINPKRCFRVNWPKLGW